MNKIPFTTIDWSDVEKIESRGVTGSSVSQTIEIDGLRIRKVEYLPGYLADHWCQKGHIIYCLEGDFISEMESGEKFTLSKGMMYIVSDHMSSHRSTTINGATLLIIDGQFLA